MMNNRQRILNTLNFEKPDDRLPIIEWASWWDKTYERWKADGLPESVSYGGLSSHFGLDEMRQFWLNPLGEGYHENSRQPVMDMDSYREIKRFLYPKDRIEGIKESVLSLRDDHEKGKIAVWFTLEGFFWFPRVLFGIENHLYAFYDEPELMRKINSDLTEYNIFLVEELCKLIKPDFMTFAEDMSYNHGSMISRDVFDEFMLPFYKRVVPVIKRHGIIPLVDTDGYVEDIVPWFIEAGIEGVLPLERQSGVDVARIRKNYPDFKMVGGYDKMVMSKGENAMRREFERLLPVMRSGGFIPSCDHQTPPGVSLENYRVYVKLMREYAEKSVVCD